MRDRQRREIHDRFEMEGLKVSGFTGFDIISAFGDFFEDFFGFWASQSQRHRKTAQQGADLRYDLTISLHDAAFGKETEIEIPKTVSCQVCSGSGAKPGTSPTLCPNCRGRGQVSRSQGFFSIRMTCDQCHGEGRVILQPCKECRGTGKVRERKKIEVKLPPGVDTGSKLKIRGEGEEGERGGPPGDLYVFIHVEPHNFFSRDGDDVICQIPISFLQTALGVNIEVPSLNGKRKLSIPKGTESGDIFRLKGERFPRLRGHGKGDLVVQTVAKTPKHLTKRQEELLKEFEELSRR